MSKEIEKGRGREMHPDDRNYRRTEMQKERILQSLREMGCRITKQRLVIIDIILEEEFSCPKEIYYRAAQKDEKIGIATVYRMVNALEEIGAISRKNMYKISYSENCCMDNACTVQFEDGTKMELSGRMWNNVLRAGMKQCGLEAEKEVQAVFVRECSCSLT